MLKLTPPDLTILCAIYNAAPTRPEIEAIVSDSSSRNATTLLEFKRRLYRLSHHGLCASCQIVPPIRWILTPTGESIVKAIDGTDWDHEGFVYEYRKND